MCGYFVAPTGPGPIARDGTPSYTSAIETVIKGAQTMAVTETGIDTTALNSDKFFSQLDRLMGASFGVIAIRSREPIRARMLLHQWSSLRGMDFRVWTCLQGWVKYKRIPTHEKTQDEVRPRLNLEDKDLDFFMIPDGDGESSTIQLEKAFRTFYDRAKTNVDPAQDRIAGMFVGIAQDMINDFGIQQHIRDHAFRSFQREDRVFLLLNPGVVIPDAIQNDCEVIDLHTPSFAELAEDFDGFMSQKPASVEYNPTPEDRELILTNALGMTQVEFGNAIALGLVDIGNKVTKAKLEKRKVIVTARDFLEVVKQRKVEVLKQTQILKLIPDVDMGNVGGLDLLKDWLEERRAGFSPEAKKFGLTPPKGFLLVGPPGTGKSLVGKATAHALRLPLINFDVSSVFNQFVGQSEGRMRSALAMLEDMAPCVVFMDEIDKSLSNGGGGGDGGVGQRIFGLLLTWMQERQDKGIPVLVIASANNVQNIPPELLRKGRFDAIWALSYPNFKEREEILRIHVTKRKHGDDLTDNEYVVLGRELQHFVGAEIEHIVEEALYLDFGNGSKKLTAKSIRQVMAKTIPQSKAFSERVTFMKQWAEQNARPASSVANYDPTEEKAENGIVAVKRTLKAPITRRSANS